MQRLRSVSRRVPTHAHQHEADFRPDELNLLVFPRRRPTSGSRGANAAVPSAAVRCLAESRLVLQFFHFVRPTRRVTHLQRGSHPDDSCRVPVATALSTVSSVVAAQTN